MIMITPKWWQTHLRRLKVQSVERAVDIFMEWTYTLLCSVAAVLSFMTVAATCKKAPGVKVSKE